VTIGVLILYIYKLIVYWLLVKYFCLQQHNGKVNGGILQQLDLMFDKMFNSLFNII